MLKPKKYKIARRLGPSVFEKTQTEKFALSVAKRKPSRPARRRSVSDYNRQLLEKQKARFSYGMTERQFSRYVKEALARRKMVPAAALGETLESRFDNVVYRSGLAQTRRAARQLVAHGHMLVNGKKIRVPSHRLRQGDVISIRPGSASRAVFENLSERLSTRTLPAWLLYDAKAKEAKISKMPALDDPHVDLNAVIEFYSR